MSGSDDSTRLGYVGHRQSGVGHYSALKCIRCEGLIGHSTARRTWRGVKQARFCRPCDSWWLAREEARAAA